jgi:nitrogen regulatory protein PII
VKLLRAIVRPECEERVIRALEEKGIYAFTKVPVTGRGRQGGAQVGGMYVTELAKTMLLLVVEDAQAEATVRTVMHAAHTGIPGDGRVFVSHVERAVRLRTGEVEAEGGDGARVVTGGGRRVDGLS